MRKFWSGLVLVALLIGALFLPTGDTLECYDVEELVYGMGRCKIGLEPPPVEVNLQIFGRDLADQLRWLVPGSNRIVTFSNDCIIVRATTIQHAAVQACIQARRWRNRSVQALAVCAFHVKTALSKRLFGMITR